MYPKIYLAMDNCVFYKRWTKPSEFARKMRELGISYIEASADTELDPLYMGADYLADWIDAVREAEAKYGVKVCNLYSGHGTYSTLGLAHTDERVREHMLRDWFFPMLETAGKLSCGMGFFAHAFSHETLQSAEEYARYVEILTENLARVNEYAGSVGCGKLGIEQMYTPHQYPWRLKDTRDLMRAVTQRSGRDFYFTEDTGHHHTKFMKPNLAELVRGARRGLWLGSDAAYELAENGGDAAAIERDIAANPQLFALESDGDCYETLRKLGCYSPIVHLQQTNGSVSAHIPFTEEENARGKINGADVLKAIKQSYDAAEEEGMPARTDEIYLTLELFSGTTSIMHDVLKDCESSVEYWRRYIPKDGMPLDELAGGL